VYYPLHYIDSVSPVADPSRWPLLDPLFSFVYTFAVPLLFLVSGLFVFPALEPKGSAGFFFSRLRRLGIPFLAAAFLISPLAFWPSYLRSITNSPTPYWTRYFTVDGWLIGAPWFLWVLLVFDGKDTWFTWFGPFDKRHRLRRLLRGRVIGIPRSFSPSRAKSHSHH
jgi:hypothetical protein